jgi:hypothetical protein
VLDGPGVTIVVLGAEDVFSTLSLATKTMLDSLEVVAH